MNKEIEKLKNIIGNYAIYSGDIIEGEGGKVYFYPKKDVAESVGLLMDKYLEILEENDRLVGENFRLSKMSSQVK